MKEKDRNDKALKKLIAERFSNSLMSDAKWVKLIRELVELTSFIHFCSVKLLWDDGAIRTLLFDEHTTYLVDYYPTSMEDMLTGKPTGWYNYKEIEWIEIIPLPTDNTIQEHLEPLYQGISSLGHFEVDRNEARLKIFAYR